MPESSSSLGLSAALEALREELEAAWKRSADSTVRFVVNNVTLTLEAVARRDVEGSGKIRWWLVEAGGSTSAGTEATQTLVLTLTPGLYDERGDRKPLIAGEELVAER